MEGHSLKKMQFSKDEVWLLVLIEDWVSCLSNKKLSQAFKDFKTRVLGSEFESPFYIKENEGSAYELSNETKILETAINNCQMIGIKYFSDNEGKNKIIQNLKPLKIACFDGFWYLIALGFGDKLLKFRILNIKSVQPKNKKFVYEGNIKDILRESKNIWFESERNIEVKILVKKEVAKYFKNKKYFPMQTIDPDNKNGDFVLTCKTSKLQEIQQTILHWIPYIKIISPKNYAEGIKAKVKDYLKDID
jgi:predicted DNA-binding transcriptional regulator YafY